jgi:hypothetical protein
LDLALTFGLASRLCLAFDLTSRLRLAFEFSLLPLFPSLFLELTERLATLSPIVFTGSGLVGLLRWHRMS